MFSGRNEFYEITRFSQRKCQDGEIINVTILLPDSSSLIRHREETLERSRDESIASLLVRATLRRFLCTSINRNAFRDSGLPRIVDRSYCYHPVLFVTRMRDQRKQRDCTAK